MNNRNSATVKIGQRIKAIRLGLGLSMSEFAKRVDPNGKARSGTVSNWEHGKNSPNAKRLKRIADLGNVTVKYLRGESDDPTGYFDLLENGIPIEDAEKFVQQEKTTKNPSLRQVQEWEKMRAALKKQFADADKARERIELRFQKELNKIDAHKADPRELMVITDSIYITRQIYDIAGGQSKAFAQYGAIMIWLRAVFTDNSLEDLTPEAIYQELLKAAELILDH